MMMQEEEIMDRYYVNKTAQANGDHEVHKESCDELPNEYHRWYLGYLPNCHEAVKKAREFYSQVDGCKFCSKECHKS
jgi:hypothetical protein